MNVRLGVLWRNGKSTARLIIVKNLPVQRKFRYIQTFNLRVAGFTFAGPSKPQQRNGKVSNGSHPQQPWAETDADIIDRDQYSEHECPSSTVREFNI